MRQAGTRVLPKPALREGWTQAPRAMDGIPAPISSMVDPAVSPKAKAVVQSIISLQFENTATEAEACTQFSDDFIWYGPAGFGVAYSCASYYKHFLGPLYDAFP